MLKTILAIAGALVFILLIWYSGPQAIWNAATQANPFLLLAALACLALITLLKGLRLHALLKHSGSIARREALAVFSFGQLANQGITTALGEVAKGALLKKVHGFSFSKSMGVILVERGYDFLFTVFFAAIALAALRPDSLPFLGAALAIVFFGVAAAAFAPGNWFSFLKRWKKVYESASKFRQGIKSLQPKTLAYALAFSAAAWLFEGLGNQLIFSALGIQLPILTVLGITSAGLIVGFATAIPGGIGSREATLVLLYAAAGVSAPAVIAQALLYRIGMTGVSLASYAAAGKK
ncbi:flippase-like domain-containing protein [Candidatus Micrarchaeota archaeon]|nr:flippase-like domain-containing protein [Candidatus Micrarchaeota archaeon]